jgi:hypothetical protein
LGANGSLIRLEKKRFGMLVVVRRHGSVGKRPTWLCRCDCGREVVVFGVKLRRGQKKSCGVGHRFKWKVLEVSKIERRCYHQMLQRCYNPKNSAWHNYGGRGIRVCRSWRLSFNQFLADVGPRPSLKHSIDRYPDVDGDYEPSNVRWATASEQARNKRVTVRVLIEGAAVPVSDFAEKAGVNAQMIKRRLARGWSVEDALTKPAKTWLKRDPWPQEWLNKFK